MKTLIIAEKPSVARAIASAIPGQSVSKKGYIEIGDTLVTWCVGHLLENATPEIYDPSWKSWSLNNLPFPIKEWKVVPKPKTVEQLNIIGTLLKQATTVVNGGDPDREGLMLVNEVLEYFGWAGHTQRIILNSNDLPSVKKALANLVPNSQYDNLYESAKCRSRADWLFGLSATRAATRSYVSFGDKTIISVGRVQTPALWLVVNRDNEIDSFNSKSFYTVEATAKTVSGDIIALSHEPSPDKRIFDKQAADAVASSIVKTDQVVTVTQSKVKSGPPKPYSLLTFSLDANEAFGWSAKECLDVLQELYSPEYALTTYPRTDCEYLKTEQMPDAVSVASTCISVVPEAQSLAHLIKPRPSIYDSSKVTEHHAIIPTKTSPPSTLQGKHFEAYRLVAKRFIMSLLPDHEFNETVVSFEAGSRQFLTKGETDINLSVSWASLTTKKLKATLPSIKNGETVKIASVKVKQGKTTPPKRYTEVTLCQDMASVAKFVNDPGIKARLKETNGIGTPATWPSIIETLKARKYIEPKGKKQIVSTEFGKKLVSTLPTNLMSPGLTALWEEALESVAKGEMQPQEFMARTVTFVTQRIAEIKNRKASLSSHFSTKQESRQPARKASQSKSSSARSTGSTRPEKANAPSKPDRFA